MAAALLKEFAQEKIVLMNSGKKHKLPFNLEGITRLIDKKGHMLAVVLDKKSWENLLETLEYEDPGFWNDIAASRKSGRVPASDIERRLGIK